MRRETTSAAALRKRHSRQNSAANRILNETEKFLKSERQRIAKYRVTQNKSAEKKTPLTAAEIKRKSRQRQKDKMSVEERKTLLIKERQRIKQYRMSKKRLNNDDQPDQRVQQKPMKKPRTKEMMPQTEQGQRQEERERIAAYRKSQKVTQEGREKMKLQRQKWQET